MRCTEWSNQINAMRSVCCFRWRQLIFLNLWTQKGKPLSLLIVWADQSEWHFKKGSVFFSSPNQGLFQIQSCIRTQSMSHQSPVGVLLPCCSTRGYYQLMFKGSFNNKPIPGPSVNLTVIPDPNKPVSLSVEYDDKAKLPAGGKFPGLNLYCISIFFSVCWALVSQPV